MAYHGVIVGGEIMVEDSDSYSLSFGAGNVAATAVSVLPAEFFEGMTTEVAGKAQGVVVTRSPAGGEQEVSSWLVLSRYGANGCMTVHQVPT